MASAITCRRDHLILGHSPGPGRDLTRRVLDCRSGRRLAELAGTTIQEVLDRCDTHNAFVTGEESTPEARRHVRRLLGRYRTVMILGVATARLVRFAAPSVDGDVFALPHTSGLNHWWNDPDNLDRGRAVATTWWSRVVDFDSVAAVG